MAELMLSVIDCVVICVCLLLSAYIGFAIGCYGKKQKSNEEFLLAGRSMSLVPVSFSMMSTFMSATTLMGVSSDIYRFGMSLMILNLGFTVGICFAAFVFIPLYHVTKVTTAFEYLELRLGKTARRMTSLIGLLHLIFLTGATLYAPALALNAVTGVPVWLSVISLGIICTFYCTLGGIKAVLWTNVFQAILMYACLFTILISGFLKAGGFRQIFDMAYDGQRLEFPTFGVNLDSRYTFWSVFFQGFVVSACCFGCSQGMVQRLLTLKNTPRAQMAAILALPMVVFFHLSTCFCGLIFYAYFRDCDPIAVEEINSPDQLMPLYILRTLSGVPGLVGLCVAGIFSASLSTLSSQVNSITAITLQDFMIPCFNAPATATCSMVITVFFGFLSVCLTFLVAVMGGLIQMSFSILGVFAGPALALYLLAALTEKANEKGALLGVVAGMILGGFLSVTSAAKKYPTLPTSTECPENLDFLQNTTSQWTSTFSPVINETITSNVENDFIISYMWISTIAMIVTLLVGYASSLLVECLEGEQKLDKRFLSPVRLWFYKKETYYRNKTNILDMKL